MATPEVRHLEAPEPWRLRAHLIAFGPLVGAIGGQEPRVRLGRVVDREPEGRVSPQALSGGCGVLRLGQVSSLEGVRERTRWV